MNNSSYHRQNLIYLLKSNKDLSYQLESVRNLLKKTIDKNQVVLIIQRVFKKWIQNRVNRVVIIQKFVRRILGIRTFRNKILAIYLMQLFFRHQLIKLHDKKNLSAFLIQVCFREHLIKTSPRERDLLSQNYRLKNSNRNLLDYSQQLNQKLKSNQSYIEKEFECPISMKKISESRDLRLSKVDGRFYERYSILKWLRNNPVSPLTRQPMRSTDLVPVNWLYSILDNSQLSLKCPKWELNVVDFMSFNNLSSPWYKVPFIEKNNCRSRVCLIVSNKGIGIRFSDFLYYCLESKGYFNLDIFLEFQQTRIKIHTQSWLKKRFSYLRDVNYYFSTREILLEQNQVLSDLFWILNKRLLRKNLDSKLIFELSFCHGN